MANSKTSFKKGKSGNPEGRGKGAKNKSTIAWNKIRALAIDNYSEAYEELRNHMKAGEGWAWQLFFRHLVPQKPIDNAYIIVELPEKLEGQTIEEYLKLFVKGLKGKNEYTIDEWVRIVSALSRIEFHENLKEAWQNMTSEELKQEIKKCDSEIEEAMQQKE